MKQNGNSKKSVWAVLTALILAAMCAAGCTTYPGGRDNPWRTDSRNDLSGRVTLDENVHHDGKIAIDVKGPVPTTVEKPVKVESSSKAPVHVTLDVSERAPLPVRVIPPPKPKEDPHAKQRQLQKLVQGYWNVEGEEFRARFSLGGSTQIGHERPGMLMIHATMRTGGDSSGISAAFVVQKHLWEQFKRLSVPVGNLRMVELLPRGSVVSRPTAELIYNGKGAAYPDPYTVEVKEVGDGQSYYLIHVHDLNALVAVETTEATVDGPPEVKRVRAGKKQTYMKESEDRQAEFEDDNVPLEEGSDDGPPTPRKIVPGGSGGSSDSSSDGGRGVV